MSISPTASDQVGAEGASSTDRVRAAALQCLAVHGSEGTSLKMIADAAGVSIGLIQHHFGTKAELIEAVDDHVMAVIGEAAAGPLPSPPADPVAAIGERVTSMIGDHTDVVDYLARAFIDGNSIGATVFDRFVAIGTGWWDQIRKDERTRPDLDPIWGTLNPLILGFGAVLLRPHIDRHLPEPFTTPAQLRRWETAVNSLVFAGQVRRAPGS